MINNFVGYGGIQMAEVGMAIEARGVPYGTKTLNWGREVEDIAGYFGKFSIPVKLTQYDKPMVKKLLQVIVLKHRHSRLPQDIKWRHWKKNLRVFAIHRTSRLP